jgi:hypothetical protein
MDYLNPLKYVNGNMNTQHTLKLNLAYRFFSDHLFMRKWAFCLPWSSTVAVCFYSILNHFALNCLLLHNYLNCTSTQSQAKVIGSLLIAGTFISTTNNAPLVNFTKATPQTVHHSHNLSYVYPKKCTQQQLTFQITLDRWHFHIYWW